jgi:hypothetical protein
MVDMSTLESLYTPSWADFFRSGVFLIPIALWLLFVIWDKVTDYINDRRPPPVVGHLTKQQWLEHRHTFNGSSGSVVQWLYVHGLPPLNKEAYSAEQWENLSTCPIGTAFTPAEYLPARYRREI